MSMLPSFYHPFENMIRAGDGDRQLKKFVVVPSKRNCESFIIYLREREFEW